MHEVPPSGDPSRAVMVDVGPGFGALVLTMPAAFEGKEIEISQAGAPAGRQHVYVLPRQLPKRTTFAAVFPRLAAGTHLLWSPAGELLLTVEVGEGAVAETAWPAATPGARYPAAPAAGQTLADHTTKGD